MITLLHIIIALISSIYLTALVVRPLRLSFSFALVTIAGTLGSGILLMIVQPSTMAHVCMSGSLYLVAATGAVLFARSRKAKYFAA